MYRNPRFWLLSGGLVFLIICSLYLARNRIYQVDECQNLFMARVIGTGQSNNYFTSASLWLIGPLAWLAGSAEKSGELFSWARLIFLGVFWLNILLIALATGIRIRSPKGCFILFMAASLAPLWDYGFEIRHDNLILMGLLLMWWMGRTSPRGNTSYFILGLLTIVLPFVAFKSLAYVIPLSLFFLILPPPAHKLSRKRLSASWFMGVVVAFVLCLLIYTFSGLWGVYLSAIRGVNATPVDKIYNPWITLMRPFTQTPLLFGLTAVALWRLGRNLRYGLRAAFEWENHSPECVLFLIALGVLFINPTPFPYNLVNLVPFAFILSYRFLAPLTVRFMDKPRAQALCLTAILLIHLVPFVNATRRHVDWSNRRQRVLMSSAEALTDPVRDPVYDAIGMVPTRRSVGFYWYLHSLNIQSFAENKIPSVPQMLDANPPAVFIPSYRTDWLSNVEMEFIKKRYIPLSDDFWVLGQILPIGGGSFDVVHSGRYQLFGLHNGKRQPIQNAKMDRQALASSVVELGRGRHNLESNSDFPPAVVWIGPALEHLPDLGTGNHNGLFVNWY